MSDREDAMDVSAMSTALRLEYDMDMPVRRLEIMLRGLAALAPNSLWYHEGKFALNASIDATRKELSASIKAVSEKVTDQLADALGGDD